MTRRGRWALLAIVAIPLVALAVAVANVDRYLESQRDEIQETLSRFLAREASFEEIGLSLLPLGIVLTHPRIEEEPGISDEPFLTAELLELDLALLAALRGQIHVERALLKGPVLRIHRLEDRWNFEGLVRSEPEADDSPESESGQSAFVISRLHVRDGNIRYLHEGLGVDVDLHANELEIDAEPWSPGQAIRFETRAALFEAPSQNATLAAAIRPRMAGEEAFLDLHLRLDSVEAAKLVALEIAGETLPDGFEASGPLRADLRLSGTASQLELEGSIDASDLQLEVSPVERSPGRELLVSFRATLTDATADVSMIELTGEKLALTGQFKLEHGEPSTLQFSSRAKTLPLLSLGLAAEADPAAEAEQEQIEDLDLRGRLTLAATGPIGTIEATSSRGLVRDFGYDDLVISARLESERDLVELRAVDGQLRGVDYTSLELELEHAGDRTDFQGIGHGVMGSVVTATGHTKPDDHHSRRTVVEGRIENGHIELLDEFLRPDGASRPEGKLSADLVFDIPGTSWEQIRPLLSGTARLKIEEGLLRNLNLADAAIDAIASVPALSLILPSNLSDRFPDVFGDDHTRFDTIDTIIEIADGHARSEDIRLQTSAYSATGRGTVSLEGEVDMGVTLTFSKRYSERIVGKESLMSLVLSPTGLLAVPFRLSGQITEIETRADPVGVARASSLIAGALKRGVVDGVVGGVRRGFDAIRPGKKAPASPED